MHRFHCRTAIPIGAVQKLPSAVALSTFEEVLCTYIHEHQMMDIHQLESWLWINTHHVAWDYRGGAGCETL